MSCHKGAQPTLCAIAILTPNTTIDLDNNADLETHRLLRRRPFKVLISSFFARCIALQRAMVVMVSHLAPAAHWRQLKGCRVIERVGRTAVRARVGTPRHTPTHGSQVEQVSIVDSDRAATNTEGVNRQIALAVIDRADLYDLSGCLLDK